MALFRGPQKSVQQAHSEACVLADLRGRRPRARLPIRSHMGHLQSIRAGSAAIDPQFRGLSGGWACMDLDRGGSRAI